MSKTKTNQTVTGALSSAALFAASTAVIKPKRVPLPEMGGDVFVKRHTLEERDAFNDAIKGVEKTTQNAIGVTLVTCDEQGNLLFTPDDVDAVKGLASSVTTKILYEYNVANGFITPLDEAIDEAKKNS